HGEQDATATDTGWPGKRDRSRCSDFVHGISEASFARAALVNSGCVRYMLVTLRSNVAFSNKPRYASRCSWSLWKIHAPCTKQGGGARLRVRPSGGVSREGVTSA